MCCRAHGLADGIFLIRSKGGEGVVALSMCTDAASGKIVHHVLASTKGGYTINSRPLSMRCVQHQILTPVAQLALLPPSLCDAANKCSCQCSATGVLGRSCAQRPWVKFRCEVDRCFSGSGSALPDRPVLLLLLFSFFFLLLFASYAALCPAPLWTFIKSFSFLCGAVPRCATLPEAIAHLGSDPQQRRT